MLGGWNSRQGPPDSPVLAKARGGQVKTTNAIQRQPKRGTRAKTGDESGRHPRAGDRLVPFAEAAEITTLGENTLRWMRHKNQGPPFFRMGRRLVVWESDLYRWIEAQAAAAS